MIDTQKINWQRLLVEAAAIVASIIIAFAIEARKESRERGEALSDEIMDVNQDAVKALFRQYDVNTLLHGHTHRPAVHEVDLGDRITSRIVLGDWYEQGSVVRWDENGPRLETMPR